MKAALKILLRNNYVTKEGKQEVLREFLFSCYTSLSYADIKSFLMENGETYLILCNERTKTSVTYKIPIVSSIVVNLLGNGETFQNIFQPLSNQPTNRYLKEIMKDLKINKTMTFIQQDISHIFST